MKYKIANTLLTKLAQQQHVTVTDISDDYGQTAYEITVDLGAGWAGDYAAADWGGWGEVSITDDTLEFTTSVYENESDDAEGALNYCFNEGVVHLHYKDFENAGLAYTSKLEDAINDKILERTGLLYTDGSEQGMQGMDCKDSCYLSLDVGTSEEFDESADVLTAAQRAAIKQWWEDNKHNYAQYAAAAYVKNLHMLHFFS